MENRIEHIPGAYKNHIKAQFLLWKSSYFVFHQGFKHRNDKATRSSASCFHLFSRVAHPVSWNAPTRHWIITSNWTCNGQKSQRTYCKIVCLAFALIKLVLLQQRLEISDHWIKSLRYWTYRDITATAWNFRSLNKIFTLLNIPWHKDSKYYSKTYIYSAPTFRFKRSITVGIFERKKRTDK